MLTPFRADPHSLPRQGLHHAHAFRAHDIRLDEVVVLQPGGELIEILHNTTKLENGSLHD